MQVFHARHGNPEFAAFVFDLKVSDLKADNLDR
jgi:hypothetical protein